MIFYSNSRRATTLDTTLKILKAKWRMMSLGEAIPTAEGPERAIVVQNVINNDEYVRFQHIKLTDEIECPEDGTIVNKGFYQIW